MAAVSDELKTVVEQIKEFAQLEADLFDQWQNSDSYEGPDESYWDAVKQWLGVFSPREMPHASLRMADLKKYFYAHEASGRDVPVAEYWNARQAASNACLMAEPKLSPLPTPAEFVAQKVSHRQIGFAWMILREDGSPDVPAVERELANPGSVLTEEHLKMVHEHRLGQLGFGPRAVAPERAALTVEPPAEEPPTRPPGIEQMIDDRATIEQIAKLKQRQYGGEVSEWASVVEIMSGLMTATLDRNAREMALEGGRESVRKLLGRDANASDVYIPPKMEPVEVILENEGQDEVEEVQTVSINQQVYDLFDRGNDSSAIARELNISAKEVKWILRDRPNGEG